MTQYRYSDAGCNLVLGKIDRPILEKSGKIYFILFMNNTRIGSFVKNESRLLFSLKGGETGIIYQRHLDNAQ